MKLLCHIQTLIVISDSPIENRKWYELSAAD